MNVLPSVYILARGVKCPVSPKSYVNLPLARLGPAAGSTATTRAWLWPPILRPRYGITRPAKLDPPPVQPTITSGSSPAMAICSIASSPITVVQQYVIQYAAERVLGVGIL